MLLLLRRSQGPYAEEGPVRCSHPDSALLALRDDLCWCSRCGSLAEFNEVYEKTWRPPSIDPHAELAVSEEVRLAQAAHIRRLVDRNCSACGREGTVQTYCCKCGKEAT